MVADQGADRTGLAAVLVVRGADAAAVDSVAREVLAVAGRAVNISRFARYIYWLIKMTRRS